MKKKLTLTLILYFFSLCLYSNTPLIIGNEDDFKNFSLSNLHITSGEKGKKNLEIVQGEYSPTPETDLLVHFNDINFGDSAGNYIVKEQYNNISDIEKKFGKSSAYFLKDKGITFSSNDESMFTKGRILDDFSIEFWIYPTTISNDTILFSWKGVNKVEDLFIAQKIKCYFQNRKVIWSFDNFFIPDDFSNYSIELLSKSKLIPNKWSHHLIRYNSYTGMIEYLINGIPEDIKYSTPSKKEEPDIYPPYVGIFSKSDIFIGEKYRGFIDELRISESFIQSPNLNNFKTFGTFNTPVYDLNGDTVNINSIITVEKIVKESNIKYYYRSSNDPFTQENENLPWKELKSNDCNDKGRYLQVKGTLFSNGSKNLSPKLQDIIIDWSVIPSPPAPIVMDSKAGKNIITLTWKPVKYYEVDGYYLYIGDESNKYQEIIDVGSKTTYTIRDLKSDKIYYFSLRSYSGKRKSEFSKEIYNRPE